MIRFLLESWKRVLTWLLRTFRRERPQSETPAYRVIARVDAWRVNTPVGWIKIPRDGRWAFNDDVECPSFSPSVVEEWENPDGSRYCNHVVIRDGMAQFLADCTHEWAGKTVELIPLNAVEVAFYYAVPEGVSKE